MSAILIFREAAFEPQDIAVMSIALEDICKALDVPADRESVREMIALHIIELVRRGERSPTRTRERLLNGASGKTAA